VLPQHVARQSALKAASYLTDQRGVGAQHLGHEALVDGILRLAWLGGNAQRSLAAQPSFGRDRFAAGERSALGARALVPSQPRLVPEAAWRLVRDEGGSRVVLPPNSRRAPRGSSEMKVAVAWCSSTIRGASSAIKCSPRTARKALLVPQV